MKFDTDNLYATIIHNQVWPANNFLIFQDGRQFQNLPSPNDNVLILYSVIALPGHTG